MTVTALCDTADVVAALGLSDESDLSDSQSARIDNLITRVSRLFALEAGRPFGPSTDTVRLLVRAGRVRLPEPISAVSAVTSATFVYNDTDTDVDVSLYGTRELLVEYAGDALTSGIYVTVTYTHAGAVPDEVSADVAAIVARLLSVDPSSGGVVSETAGPFSARYADWATTGTVLTKEELATARSYRYPTGCTIVLKP